MKKKMERQQKEGSIPVDTRRRFKSIRRRIDIKTKLCVYRDSEIWGNTVWGGRRGGNPSEYLGACLIGF